MTRCSVLTSGCCNYLLLEARESALRNDTIGNCLGSLRSVKKAERIPIVRLHSFGSSTKLYFTSYTSFGNAF